MFKTMIDEMRAAGRSIELTTEELFAHFEERLMAIEAKVFPKAKPVPAKTDDEPVVPKPDDT